MRGRWSLWILAAVAVALLGPSRCHDQNADRIDTAYREDVVAPHCLETCGVGSLASDVCLDDFISQPSCRVRVTSQGTDGVLPAFLQGTDDTSALGSGGSEHCDGP